MNLHPQAIVFRTDLHLCLSSFTGITLWGITERFVLWLNTKGAHLEPITIYKYLTESTVPAWLLPCLCEFLTEEPWINNESVWQFIKKWGYPISSAASKVIAKVATRQELLLDQVNYYQKFIFTPATRPYLSPESHPDQTPDPSPDPSPDQTNDQAPPSGFKIFNPCIGFCIVL